MLLPRTTAWPGPLVAEAEGRRPGLSRSHGLQNRSGELPVHGGTPPAAGGEATRGAPAALRPGGCTLCKLGPCPPCSCGLVFPALAEHRPPPAGSRVVMLRRRPPAGGEGRGSAGQRGAQPSCGQRKTGQSEPVPPRLPRGAPPAPRRRGAADGAGDHETGGRSAPSRERQCRRLPAGQHPGRPDPLPPGPAGSARPA